MPAGRPAFQPTEKQRGVVETMAAFGTPHEDIARVIGIDDKTLRKHFREELDLGTIKANAKVAQNLFDMACKPNRDGLVAAIFWLKVRAGWSEYKAPQRPEPLGKKEQAEVDAQTAIEGTSFGDYLRH